MRTREQVLADVLVLLGKVAREWEVEGGLGESTRLFEDLNFESLDLVVLGAAVQEHFGRSFPFAEFFAEVGQRQQKDLSVREWVDFIYKHLEPDFARAGEPR
jgi:acyl carrier protein